MAIMYKMLTIAGSDSGGGAGIQADVRTGSMLGCHVSTAVTAVTVQNSRTVSGVLPVPPDVVAAQIEAVMTDIGADAVKTGMLHDADLINAVAASIKKFGVRALVVDPVMVAKGGAPLLQESAVGALKEKLLPLALVVTPNLPEAEALTGISITDGETALNAMQAILNMGPRGVLLKGGHGFLSVVEDLYLGADGGFLKLTAPRQETLHTHGTGCTLSAAITAYLAMGVEVKEAVRRAHAFLQEALKASYPTGGGHGSTNPCAASRAGEGAVIRKLYEAWEILEEANPWGLIPEVQSNLAQMLDNASSFEEVAGFPGRIVKCGERVRRVEGPRFGASRHMAKILLAGAKRKSPMRAVMNIRYGDDVLAACRSIGLTVEGFDRRDEPEDVKMAEGSSLEWGTGKVLDEKGYAPDAIFDPGDVLKEPMIRIFGLDAVDAAIKVIAIWNELKRGN